MMYQAPGRERVVGTVSFLPALNSKHRMPHFGDGVTSPQGLPPQPASCPPASLGPVPPLARLSM